MMLETDINSLETKKLNLELKLNELKAEILYIKKQISQKLGSKEVETQAKIKRKKSGVDERNIENYNFIKAGYKRISNIEVSTKNILRVIDVYLNQGQYETYEDSMVKVMSR